METKTLTAMKMKSLVSKDVKLTKSQAIKAVQSIPAFGMSLFGKKSDAMGVPYVATQEEVIKEINMGGCLVIKGEKGINIRSCGDVSFFGSFVAA